MSLTKFPFMLRSVFLFLFVLIVQQAYALDASISYTTFNASKSPFIEVHLYLVGSTINFEKIDSLSQAEVEVTLIFKAGEEIIKFDKYALKSPLTKEATDFVDLKRYTLPNGVYDLEVVINDLKEENNIGTYNTGNVVVDYSSDKMEMSDIQLLTSCVKAETESNFTKNGLKMEMAPFSFYNKQLGELIFYTEIYGADKHLKEDYMISYSIDKITSLKKEKSFIIGHKRRSAKAIDVFVMPVDISKLSSGNYDLKIEVRNKNKELLCTKSVMFQRSNPFLEKDFKDEIDFDISKTFVDNFTEHELRYSLKAIAPKLVGGDVEVMNIVLEENDLLTMKNQLFSYWANRNSINPESAYEKYMEVAKAVDNTFEWGLGYGFESDRGYTFMKYGKPTSSIQITDEPDAPPYEIWYYDDFPQTNQTNVRFLFYNPTLAGGHYRLLHSTARGELSNDGWLAVLYADVPEIDKSSNGPSSNASATFSRNAATYFNDF